MKNNFECAIIHPFQKIKTKGTSTRCARYADMAQLVEQLIRNEQAVGSSPTISSKKEVRSMRWSNLFLIVNKRIKSHIIYGFLYLFLSLPYN